MSLSHPFSQEVALALAGLFFLGILPAMIYLALWAQHRGDAGSALLQRAGKRRVRPAKLWPQLLPTAPTHWERTLAWAGYRRAAPKKGTLLLIGLFLLLVFVLIFGIWGIVVVGFIFVCSYWHIQSRAKRGQEKFVNELPNGLNSLADALRAGYSLPQAIAFVSSELEEPLSSVFGALVRAEQYQLSFAEGLARLSDQLDVPEWTLVVETLVAQKTAGGNTVPLLKEIATTIQGRVALEQEMKTLTAAGRLSGWIIAGLVPVMLFFFAFVSPEYLHPLYSTALGQIILAVAAALEIIGFIWIMQLTKLDY